MCRQFHLIFKNRDNVDLTKDRKLASKVSEIMINRFHFRKGIKKVNGIVKRGYIKR